MTLTPSLKDNMIKTIKEELSKFNEVYKVIIFGSFVKTNNPNDIDIAVIQDSKENFLSLSLKYRKVLRDIANKIALDIIPIKKNSQGSFLEEINNGITIYEK